MHGSVSPIDCMIFLVGKMAFCVDGYKTGRSQEVTECINFIILLHMFCGINVSLFVLRADLIYILKTL